MFQTCSLFSKTHLPNIVQHRGENILLLQFQSCSLMNIQLLKARAQEEMSTIPPLPTKSARTPQKQELLTGHQGTTVCCCLAFWNYSGLKESLNGVKTKQNNSKNAESLPLVNEENSGSGESGESIWHLPNLCVIYKSSEKQQKTWMEETHLSSHHGCCFCS